MTWFICTLWFGVLLACTIVECTVGLQLCRCKSNLLLELSSLIFTMTLSGNSPARWRQYSASRFRDWPRFVQHRFQRQQMGYSSLGVQLGPFLLGALALLAIPLAARALCRRLPHLLQPLHGRPCTASALLPPPEQLWWDVQPKTLRASAELRLVVVSPSTSTPHLQTYPTYKHWQHRMHRCSAAWRRAP